MHKTMALKDNGIFDYPTGFTLNNSIFLLPYRHYIEQSALAPDWTNQLATMYLSLISSHNSGMEANLQYYRLPRKSCTPNSDLNTAASYLCQRFWTLDLQKSLGLKVSNPF